MRLTDPEILRGSFREKQAGFAVPLLSAERPWSPQPAEPSMSRISLPLTYSLVRFCVISVIILMMLSLRSQRSSS